MDENGRMEDEMSTERKGTERKGREEGRKGGRERL